MLDALLIRHCAPVLAGLKTANMFSCAADGNIEDTIEYWNNQLNIKDIHIELLRGGGSALVYVYRQKRLADDLNRPCVRYFLNACGYNFNTPDEAISALKARLKSCDFPHEIGIFLGYPLGDIVGFIKNKGSNYKLCGFWKVYCDEDCARKNFEKYKKCFAVYGRLFENGRSIYDMTVRA